MSTYPFARNLDYFASFMKGYGRADYPTRAELYRDTLAYSGGTESGDVLVAQVAELLGVAPPSPQVFVGRTA